MHLWACYWSMPAWEQSALLSSGGSGTLFVLENTVRTMCSCVSGKVGAPAHSYNACNAQRRAVAALGTAVMQCHFLQCQCFSRVPFTVCVCVSLKQWNLMMVCAPQLNTSADFFDSNLFVSLFLLFVCRRASAVHSMVGPVYPLHPHHDVWESPYHAGPPHPPVEEGQ